MTKKAILFTLTLTFIDIRRLRFEVVMAEKMSTAVFWGVTPYRLVVYIYLSIYPYFI
jgi:hypothetical protein